MKLIGYLVFALFYYLFYPFTRVKKDKVFCVATHDAGKDGNIGVVVNALSKSERQFSFVYYTKENKVTQVIDFFIKKPYHLVTSEYVMLDNVFLPMAFLRMKKNVSVIQLWHGTGTIKKFGQCANTGMLKFLEYHANQSITHLIVNSQYTNDLYQKAFGVKDEVMCIYGLPRTDVLFDEEMKQKKKEDFYQAYPQLKDRNLILYAPTFRDQQVEHPEIKLPIHEILRELPEHTTILLRLHPHVAANFDQSSLADYGEQVCLVSDYPDLNAVLLVSDILITDYSSIFYEYSLLGRPMIFYCYDLDEFSSEGRGFFEDYNVFAPGCVVGNEQELIHALLNPEDSLAKAKNFAQKAFLFTDGKSTDRLLSNIFKLTPKEGDTL